MDGRSPLEMKLPMPLEALKKPILRKIDKTVVGKLPRDHWRAERLDGVKRLRNAGVTVHSNTQVNMERALDKGKQAVTNRRPRTENVRLAYRVLAACTTM
ncbi:MAG: hypothetical protein ACLR8P_23300 [Clostridium fessum]